jgi:multicomponent Na+:H+ antiporter subunit G
LTVDLNFNLDLALNLISWALMAAGVLFAAIGAIGIIRLPDVFTRMHGAGMVDTGGAGLILLGLMIQAGQAGQTLVTVKLILIAAFILFTSPAATHAVARAALNGGVRPLGSQIPKNEAPNNEAPDSKAPDSKKSGSQKPDAREKGGDGKPSTT